MSPACPESAAWFRLLDAEVTRNEEQQLEAHLATCSACRTELDELRLLVEDVRAPLVELDTVDAAASVLSAIERGVRVVVAPSPHWYRWAPIAGVAICLLLVVGLRSDPGHEDMQARGGAEPTLRRRTGARILADGAPISDRMTVSGTTPLGVDFRNLERERAVYLAAFIVDIATATSAVRNPRYRPTVYARGPGGNARAALNACRRGPCGTAPVRCSCASG